MRQNPWLGLATYNETLISQGYKFCGRERAINELYSIIDNNIFTTLYGKSGIGKSSLLQAGIFPLFRYNNYLPIMIRLGVTDSRHSASSYIDAIINAIEASIKDNNISVTTANYPSPAKEEEKLWYYFQHTQFRNSNNEVIFPIIVLDQFEELYYRDRLQLNTLLKSIYLLLDDSSINGNSYESQIINYRIVISIREDDLFHLEDSIDKLRLTEMKDNRYRLRDFSEEEAFNVITVPGDNVFNKDDINSIASLIIKETKANSTEISSAVLSLICSRIFSSVKETRLITLNDVNLFFKDAQGNFLKSFYEDIRKKLTLDQWYFIEDELVTDEGRRNSVLESEFNKVIPNSKWLFEGEHSMLRKVTIQGSTEPRIEIIHDMLAMQMLSSKKERKLQEQARKLRRQRLTAIAIIAGIVVLGVTFYLQYRSIVEERNNMYKMQSHYITEKAKKLIEEGDVNTAIRLLLNVLPENVEKPNRPYIKEAEITLRKANEFLYNQSFQLKKIFTPSEYNYSIEYSPNGKFIITASSDNTAKIWNAETGEQIGETLKHDDDVNSASFSPNGKYIVTASDDKTAKIWNAETGEQVGETLKHDKSVYSASFSYNSKFIVTTSGKTAKIWNAETGMQVGETLIHNKWCSSASFSHDDKYIVTASYDNTAKIWNAETGKQVGEALKHDSYVYSASFSPDGKFILTASSDKTAKIWNAETGEQVGETLKHNNSVNSALFSPDGKYIVTASNDYTAKIWNTETGEQIGEALKHDSYVYSASFSPDGKFIVTTTDQGVSKLWRLSKGIRKINTYNHLRILSKDGKRIATNYDFHTIKIWDIDSEKQIGKLINHVRVREVQFSPNGEYIITASDDKNAKIWNVQTGEQIGSDLKHLDLINSIQFSHNGKYIITASNDSTAKIWNAKTGEQIGPDLKHFNNVNSAQFSPDGKYIITASNDSTAKIWNAETYKLTRILKHPNTVISAQFSPNGEYIAAISTDSTAKIWNTKTYQQIGSDLTPSNVWDFFHSCFFSDDSKHLITITVNAESQLWDIKKQIPIGTYNSFITKGPDKHYFIINYESNLKLLKLIEFIPLQDLIDRYKDLFKDWPLTEEELREYNFK